MTRAFLFSMTILCPYCTALIPLAPNWKLSPKDGIRVTNDKLWKVPGFEVVRIRYMSPGTVRKRIATCPQCGGVCERGYPAQEAQAGRMGQWNTAGSHPIYIRFTGVGSRRRREGSPDFMSCRGMCYITLTGNCGDVSSRRGLRRRQWQKIRCCWIAGCSAAKNQNLRWAWSG